MYIYYNFIGRKRFSRVETFFLYYLCVY